MLRILDKPIIPRIIGIIWIGYLTINSYLSIGEMPTCKPFDWHVPILIFGAFTFTFIVGYWSKE